MSGSSRLRRFATILVRISDPVRDWHELVLPGCLAMIGVWGTLALILSLISTPSPADDQLSAEVLSDPSVVFNWSTQRCDDDDIPDNPIRAVRLANGTVLALGSSFDTRPFLGRDLNSIQRECVLVHKSRLDADPAQFADRTWLASTWTEDGKTIFALGHNEYQADKHPGRCKYPKYVQCWYNTIGLFRSIDGGKSFERAAAKPMAAPAFQQDFDQGRPRGFFAPTNIIKMDGYYYTLIRTTGGGAQSSGECLFRAASVGDISAWTYFDGSDFIPSALDPYHDDVSHVRPCAILRGLIGSVGSVVKDLTTGLFIAVTGFQGTNDNPGGILFATSRDLLTWSKPQNLVRFPLAAVATCKDPFGFGYPALLDPRSTSLNFEDTAGNPYLYLTRTHIANCHMTLNRDLVRMSVRFH